MNKWNSKRKLIFFRHHELLFLHASLNLYRSQTPSKHISTIQPKQDLHNLTFKFLNNFLAVVKKPYRNMWRHHNWFIKSNVWCWFVDGSERNEIKSAVITVYKASFKEQISAWICLNECEWREIYTWKHCLWRFWILIEIKVATDEKFRQNVYFSGRLNFWII